MIKASDALQEIVEANPLLHFGLRERLLNLSQLARFVHPLLEVRTKKELQVQSIVMALSRLQQTYQKSPQDQRLQFKLKNIALHSELMILTFHKTKETSKAVHALYSKILSSGGFITITEGVSEVTVIVEEAQEENVDKTFPSRPLHKRKKLASLGLRFDESYLSLPGLFHFIFQQLYLQNINIAEIASTATELIIYLDEKDIQLAFDTLYRRFVVDPVSL